MNRNLPVPPPFVYAEGYPTAEMSAADEAWLREQREGGADDGIADGPSVDQTDAEELADTAKLLTDTGNAALFIIRNRGRFLHSFMRNAWLYWDGKRWAWDETGRAIAAAKQTALSRFDEAKHAVGGDAEKLAKWALKSQQHERIAAMLKLARPELAVTADRLDADPMLLNVNNGILDLRTGTLRPHDPAALMTKLAPVDYDRDAQCPLWCSFLTRINEGNAGKIDYLARIAGLCLTGSIAVQELFIFWGGGANGKNVFLDTLMGMLGDYAAPAPDSLLTIRSRDEHPTEISDLQALRMAVGSELEEGAKLRVSLVKKLTGDKFLKGRHMRQDFETFPRTHKLIIATNNKPLIRENTDAIWRRVRLVPFTITIPPEERDPHLTAKLVEEWPGILAWAVRGCLDWQANGMNPPPEVLAASAEYQQEQDVLGDFLATFCVYGESCRVVRNDLFLAYQSWAQQTREPHPLDKTAFFERIRRLNGISESAWRVIGSNVPQRGFRGIGLAAKAQEASDEM